MNNNNTKGFTLVEVLATLVLISLVFLLIVSTQIFGQKEFNTQSEQISNEESIQFVIKDITREVRRIDDNAKIKIDNSNAVLTIGEKIYSMKNNELMKNKVILAENIGLFKVDFINSKDALLITIKSNGSKRTDEKIEALIFLREGDPN